MAETRNFRNAPWAGVGNHVDNAVNGDIVASMQSAGLDWQVGLADLVTVAEAQRVVDTEPAFSKVEPNIVERAVVRQDNGNVLGVVGPRWHPLQNAKMFEWFQPFLDQGVCSIHSAGSFYGGRKVWVLAEMSDNPVEIVPGDEIAPYMMMSNGHDGKMSVRVGFTFVRIFCANCLQMAHNSKMSTLLRVRHTSQVEITVERIQDIVDTARRDFAATAEQYQFLASRGINSIDLRKYVKVILGCEKVADEDLKTRTQNKIEQVIGLVEAGRGNSAARVRGTWWAAYNGVTEYLNHRAGRNANNRLNSLWLGQNENVNTLALEKAVEMAA